MIRFDSVIKKFGTFAAVDDVMRQKGLGVRFVIPPNLTQIVEITRRCARNT